MIPVPDSWKRYVPGLELPILDVSRMADSAMSGEPILNVTLMLLKYGRDSDLEDYLRPVLREVANQFRGPWVANLLDTIRKYIMSVNPEVGEEKVDNLFYEFWPVQPEPGSVADQLLTRGRQEGREEAFEEGILIGRILTLEEILDRPLTPKSELEKQTPEALNLLVQKLQQDLRNRP